MLPTLLTCLAMDINLHILRRCMHVFFHGHCGISTEHVVQRQTQPCFFLAKSILPCSVQLALYDILDKVQTKWLVARSWVVKSHPLTSTHKIGLSSVIKYVKSVAVIRASNFPWCLAFLFPYLGLLWAGSRFAGVNSTYACLTFPHPAYEGCMQNTRTGSWGPPWPTLVWEFLGHWFFLPRATSCCSISTLLSGSVITVPWTA